MAYDSSIVERPGDGGFVGVNMRDDPRLLQPGFAAELINKRARNKSLGLRPSFQTVPWAQELGHDFPITQWPMSFTKPHGFGRVYGEIDFEDPVSRREYALLAVASGTWVIEQGVEPYKISYPPLDEGVDDVVTMEQSFDEILMFRGAGKATIKWNPTTDSRWEYLVQTGERGVDDDNTYGDGTQVMPATDEAISTGSRVLAKYNGDELVVGDIFDNTRYSDATARFKINDGDSGEIVKLWRSGETQVLVFKKRMVNLLKNFSGDLSLVDKDVLPFEHGCVAKKTVATVGVDVWFLGYGGVYSISQSMENKRQGKTEPVSWPIEPLMKRVNWSAAEKACAAYFDNEYLIALPIDGSSYNNVVAVYNYLNQAWTGYWTNDWMDVRGFVRLVSGGRRKLFMVMGGEASAVAEGALVGLSTGLEDELFGTTFDIEDEVLTRGYETPQESERGVQVALEMTTRHPSYTISAVMPGVADEQLLASAVLKSAVNYYDIGKVDWDSTNVNSDHDTPGREDYRVVFPAETGVDFPHNFPVDFVEGVFPPFNPDLAQRQRERFRCSVRGEFVQVRVSNSQGLCALNRVEVDMQNDVGRGPILRL